VGLFEKKKQAEEGAGDVTVYYSTDGKIAAAQFFAANVLPEIAATRGILARTPTALMDLDDDAF
jgi:Acetyl-CoA dehydrogenase C-terminal like